MADYNLGTATGLIKIGYDGAGVQQAEKDVDKLDKRTGTATSNIRSSIGTIGGFGLAVAGGFALAAKTASDFETQISGIGAVTGATGAQLDVVRAKALQLGKDTVFSAGDAAGAIGELAKAGVSLPDILNGAADATVNLAAAGQIALPEAATIAANAMNAFGLTAKQLPGVADAIAGAANASAIDVSQFGQSLQQVGAVANIAGLSFKDTATAIALLGNAGIVGSDAGTSLKTMFQNLIPQTKQQHKLFRQLGLETKKGANAFFDQAGKIKSLADISGILQQKTAKMSQEQKLATLQVLFGSDAVRAASILTNAGAKGFTNMAKSMAKVSAADVARKRMDNFQGSLQQALGSLETVGITIGEMLLPPLRKLVDGINSLLGSFLTLPGPVKGIIVGFVGLLGTAALLVFGIYKLIGAYKATKQVINALRVANVALSGSFLANPVFLIIAAIAALVIIIILAYKHSQRFRDIVQAVWSAIKTAVSAVVNWLVGTAWPLIQTVWNGIMVGVMAVYNAVKTAFTLIFRIIAVIVLIIAAIIAIGVNLWWKYITTVVNLIVAAVRVAWTLISTIITTVMNVISAAIGFVWGIIGSRVLAALAFIRSIILLYFTVYRAIIVAILTAIRFVVNAIWNGIVVIIRGSVGLILAVIRPIGRIVGLISGWFTGAFDAVKRVVGLIVGFVGSIGGKIVSALGDFTQILYNKGRDLITGLLSGAGSLLRKIGDFFLDLVPGWIKGAFKHALGIGSPSKVFAGYGQNIMEGLMKGINDHQATIKATVMATGAGLPLAFAQGATNPRAIGNTSITNKTSSVQVVINNPVGQTSEQSMDNTLRKLQFQGVLT